MKTWQAYIAGRLVRSFSHEDLARAYAEQMRALGAEVVVRAVRLARAA